MNIQSPWGGGVDIQAASSVITAPTGEKVALNHTGDGVRVWYIDPYDNVQKVMDVALSDQRGPDVWTLAKVDIPGLVNVGTDNDPNTAKYNTQVIIDYFEENVLSGTAAALSARASEIGGVPCNLPNKQQLKIIYRVRDLIDGIDPTAAANTTKKLSNWGFGASNGSRCWSSSEASSYYAWIVDSDGAAFNHYFKSNVFGVIPILELDPTTFQPI